METDRKEEQLLQQWEDLGCRLMGVSLGGSSNSSSSCPSPPGSVPWVLAHKTQKPRVSMAARSVRGILMLFALLEPRLNLSVPPESVLGGVGVFLKLDSRRISVS